MDKNQSRHSQMKYRIFEIIQIGNRNDTISYLMDILIVINILLNILCMFLLTFDEVSRYFELIHYVENFTILFFCVEYALRFWTAEYLYPKETRIRAKIRYLYSFDGIVDLLTILPFFFLSGFVVFRMLRVVRIFHLFRLNSQYDSFNVITSVIYEKRNQIFSSVFIIMILMFASSLCMYSAEHDAQPDMFQNAFSGIWWSMSTLLTVGYGDIYPITLIGRCMAIVIAFLGVGVVAIPTGIISAGFVEQYAKLKDVESASIRQKVQFLTLKITENHNFLNMLISEISLPYGLTIPIIIRNNKIIVPNGDTRLMLNDQVVLAGENYINEMGIVLHEETIGEKHEWANQEVMNLDISRLTRLVSLERRGKIIIPHGDTVIRPGDKVIYYSKEKKFMG